MQCVICGANVTDPSEEFVFPKDKSGLYGNFLFMDKGGATTILNAYCNAHIERAKEQFPMVFGRNYAHSWDAFNPDIFSWGYPDSTGIERYAYFEEQEALAVQHPNNSTIYVYWSVDKELFEEFESSDSLGRFFALRIKKFNGKNRPCKPIREFVNTDDIPF